MRINSIYALLLCSTLSAGVYGQTKSATSKTTTVKAEILTNKSVIDLSKAGLDEELIVSKISSSSCKFDMSTDGLVGLKKEGVSAGIIKAMLDKTNGKAVASTSTPAEPAKTTTATETKSPVVSKSVYSAAELMNHVYFFNKATNSAQPLEKSVAGLRTKQGMFSGASVWHIEGDKAGIRVPQSETYSFIINTGSTALPELVLYKLKSGKNRREVANMKVSTFKGVTTGEDVISINVSKLQEGIFQITPGAKLEKGEYFFAGKPAQGANSIDAYAFGID
ncbi:MAG: hypothetical protein QM731_12440 [Chitinophagaceae bacterium]